MKKYLYFIIVIFGLILGILGALTSLKLFAAGIFAFIVFILLLVDFQKATFIVSFYILIDYIVRQYSHSQLLASYWDEMFFICCIGLWFYKWFVFRKTKPYAVSPLDLPLILFFGAGIFLLIINTPELHIGIEGFRAVAEYMLWFFITLQLLKTPKGARNLLYILVFVGALLALDGLRQYILAVPMPGKWVDSSETPFIRTRVFSIMGNPNALASVMVLLIPPSISFIFFEKNKYKRLIFGFFAFLMTATLVFTFTRAAWFGFLAAVIIYIMLKDKRLFLPSIVALVIIVIAVFIFMPSVAVRVLYLFSPEYIASSSTGGRIYRWMQGIEMFRENLLFGVGFGRFGGAVAINNGISGAFYMDNYYIKIAVETGIVGLTAFLLLIINVITWSLRAIRNLKDSPYLHLAQGAFAGMCGLLIHAFAENVFEVPAVTTYFWILAGFIMYLGYVSKEGKPLSE